MRFSDGLNWESARKFLNGGWVRFWENRKNKVTFSDGSKGSEEWRDASNTSNDDATNKKNKVTFSDGSKGSEEWRDASNTSNDEATNKKNKVTFSDGSKGSEKCSVTHDTVSKKSEFLRDRDLDTQQQGFQEPNKIYDPLDPSENQTFVFNEKTATEEPNHEPKLSPTIKTIKMSPIGQVKTMAVEIADGKWEITLFLPDNTTYQSNGHCKNTAKATARLEKVFMEWLGTLNFRVNHPGQDGYIWTDNCKCTSIYSYYERSQVYRFTFVTPAGVFLTTNQTDEFQLMTTSDVGF